MKDTGDNTAGSGPTIVWERGGMPEREALDEPHIRLRPDGRQLVIDRGTKSKEVDSGDGGHSGQDGGQDIGDKNRDPVAESTITGFSEDSRRRLRNLLHALDRDAGGLFLTLTYQNLDPSSGKAKRDLDVFWKRIRRRWPEAAAVWKMEPHTEGENRGKPHFHGMVFGVEFIPVQWLSKIWHEVTGEEDEMHEKRCVELDPFLNRDGKLQSYIAKYMDKTYDVWPDTEQGDPWHTPGRWWGVLSRKNLPFAEWEDAAVYIGQAEAMRLISELLDEWGVDIPSGVVPPSLTINTRGDPAERLDQILGRL